MLSSSCMQAQNSISNSISIWSCWWDGSQVGRVTDGPFLKCLHHFCSCISFRQEYFWAKNFEGRLLSPSFHWGPFITTGGDLLRLHLTTVGYFSYGQLQGILEATYIPGLWDVQGYPRLHHMMPKVSILSLVSQGFYSVTSIPDPTLFPLSRSTFPPRLFPCSAS